MQIQKPTFLLNEQTCRSNIRQMTDKANRNKVIFRPHFKTHQSAEIGEWFRREGTEKITVSSVTMAEYFADAGWNDILIAFPANIREIESINSLAERIDLSLTVESVFTANSLIQNLSAQAAIYLKIDTGYHRTGIPANNIAEIESILDRIKASDNLYFTGFLTHSGQTYCAKNKDEITRIHRDAVKQLLNLKARFVNDFPNLILSIGDTPSCSVLDDFNGANEIRPGNFVFYDVMQIFLGSCTFQDIAVVLACPVVAKHSERNEIVIYGGAVHLSKEFITNNKGIKVYGLVVNLKGKSWGAPLPETFVSALSQEHGIIKTTPDLFDQFTIGDVIGIVPVHSCLTADLANHYLTTTGKLLTKLQK